MILAFWLRTPVLILVLLIHTTHTSLIFLGTFPFLPKYSLFIIVMYKFALFLHRKGKN